MKKLIIFLLPVLAVMLTLVGCIQKDKTVLETPSQLGYDAETTTLDWADVPGASGYEIRIRTEEGERILSARDSETDLSALSGAFSASVRALGDKDHYDSDWTGEVACVNKYALTAPDFRFRNTDMGMVFVYYRAVAHVAEYSFRIVSNNYQVVKNSQDVSRDINALSVTLGDDYGTYVFEYALRSSSDSYKDTDWTAITFEYSAPKAATIDRNKVVVDRRDARSGVVNCAFNDAFTLSVTSSTETITEIDYTIDYFAGTITFDDDYVLTLSVGEHSYSLSTDMGDLDFVLSVTDNAPPYVISTDINRRVGSAMDSVVYFNRMGREIISVSLDGRTMSIDSYVVTEESITIFSEALAGKQVGEHELVIRLDGGFDLNVRLNIYAEGSGAYAETREYRVDKAYSDGGLYLRLPDYSPAILNSNRFPFLTEGRSVTAGSDAKIELSEGIYGYRLSADFLRSLSVGRHRLQLNSLRYDMSIILDVVDTLCRPDDVHVTIDDGVYKLVWSDEEQARSIAAGGYVLELSDSSGVRTLSVESNEVTLDELGTDTLFSVRVKSKYAGVFGESYDVIVNDVPSQYVETTYTFLGKTHDMVVSDKEELSDLISYIYYNRIKETYFYYNIVSSVAFTNIWKECLENAKNDSQLGYLRNGLTCTAKSKNDGVYAITLSFDRNADSYLNPVNSTGQTLLDVSPSCIVTSPCIETEGRADGYVFALDRVAQSESCTTGSQLFYLAEHGVRPLPESGSNAERLYQKARAVLRTICDDNMSDFEKVHAMYDWMILNTTYDRLMADTYIRTLSSSEVLTYKTFYLEGVFDDGVAVCDGYSKAFVLLCALEGIPCVRVGGTVGSANHAWNKVYIDGEWYEVDVTWGNFSIKNSETIGEYTEYICHRYLLCDNAYLNADHNEKVNYVYRRVAYQGIDVYSMSEDDYMMSVTSYEQLCEVVNGRLASDGYLELDISALETSPAAAIAEGRGIEIDAEDYRYYFKGYSDDTVIFVYVAVELPVIAKEEYSFDKADGEALSLAFEYSGQIGAVYVNRTLLGADDYTIADGVLSIPFEYLASLADGVYTISLLSAAGGDSATLTITDTRIASIDTHDIIMDTRAQTAYELGVVFYEDQITAVELKRLDTGRVTPLSAEEYAISLDSGKITLYHALTEHYEKGEYSLEIRTLHGGDDSIRLVITDTVIDGTFALIDNFRYDILSGRDLTFRVSNMSAAEAQNAILYITGDYRLTSSDYTYSADVENNAVDFTIKADWLTSMKVGSYQILVFNHADPVYLTLAVSDSAALPYALRIDMNDQALPVLLWDYDGVQTDFDVTVNGVDYVASERSFALPAGDYSQAVVTVKVRDSEQGASATLPLPVVDDDEYFDVIDFAGERINRYVTSDDELLRLFGYALVDNKTSISFYYRPDVTEQEMDRVQSLVLERGLTYTGELYDGVSFALAYVAGDHVVEFRNITATHTIPDRSSAMPEAYCVQSESDNCMLTASDRTEETVLPYFGVQRTDFSVATEAQLAYALTMGLRPVPVADSTADRLMARASMILVSIISDDMTDVQKIHCIHDYLVQNVRYDHYLIDVIMVANPTPAQLARYRSFYIEGALLDGVAVCEGFAKAFQMLCLLENIQCEMVSGVADGVDHAWNKVYVDGKAYVVDVTYDNTYYYDSDRGAYVEGISHAFLLSDDWSRLNTAAQTNYESFARDAMHGSIYGAEGDRLYLADSKSALTLLLNTHLIEDGVCEIYLSYLDVYDDIEAELKGLNLSQLLKGMVSYRLNGNAVTAYYLG